MSKKTFFQNIDSVIDDWHNTTFTFYPKDYVPGLDPDGNLTYGNGENKRGIELNTCVLFVDIRNSVSLTEQHQIRTMGKIYSVFTHCVLLAAQEDGGFVRNIIGDRVMIVFPEDNCYTNAVDCAITINQIAEHINEKFQNVEFKCGIGIDYGKMNVMKVGIPKRGQENDDNKGLVWIGYPANYASRLTDSANKTIKEEYFHVEGDGITFSLAGDPFMRKAPHKVKDFSKEELMSALSAINGQMHLSQFARITTFEKKEREYTFMPILMSDKVYKGFRDANPNRRSVREGQWKLQEFPIRDIDFPVYGGKTTWNLS